MDVVLGRLAAAAGAARAADSTTQPLADWLAETFAHWQLMRPSAHAGLDLRGSQAGPTVRVEPILISLLATLLNNAADASPDGIELIADWGDDSLRIEVLDRGPGLGGTRRASGGWGVGLTLAEAALQRFDGRLDMVERKGGGMAVRVELALARLLPQA
jgi:two-component system sensor histidine kinase RegB